MTFVESLFFAAVGVLTVAAAFVFCGILGVIFRYEDGRSRRGDMIAGAPILVALVVVVLILALVIQWLSGGMAR